VGNYTDLLNFSNLVNLNSLIIKRIKFTKSLRFSKLGFSEWPQYWIVDPLHKTIEVYKMEEDDYHLSAFAEVEGKITSTVLADFELDVKTIFQ